MSRSETLVVGGGLSGLVRGFALAARGEDVLVLEATDRPGGALRTERTDGFLLELGPNTIRPDPALWKLVADLGLEGEAVFADPGLPRFVAFGGRLHRLAPGPGVLTTSLLSPIGKLRLLAEPFVRSRTHESESVHAFFARRLGAEFAERLVAPFVSGIWAGDASRLSATEAFPLLARWETERGSLVLGALASRKRRHPSVPAPPRGLLSFGEGIEALPRALADRLGPRLRRGVRVTSIRRSDSGGGTWIAETAQEPFEASRLVLAAPAPEVARLIAPLDPGASRELDRVPMPFLGVLHLAYPAGAFREALRGFGHLVVPAPGRRVLGAVWSSSLFPDRAPAGETLLTVFVGGSRDPAADALTDGELFEIASRELAADLGASRPPRLLRATRYPHALPQYDFAHGALLSELARAEAALPGLTFLGNYRGGVSVGDVAKSAQAGS